MSESADKWVGKAAPDFTLPSSTGSRVALSSFKGKSSVVLYFYPKADTPGCTTQACGIRDSGPAFADAGAVVLGVSPDSAVDVAKFAKKFDLKFDLLGDEDHAVSETYGVWVEKSMYGKKYMGVARTTFLIDRTGIIRRVDESVKPEGHAEMMLEQVKAM